MPDHLSQIAPVDRLSADRALVEMVAFVDVFLAVAAADDWRPEIGQLGHVALATTGVFLVGGL